MLEQRRCHREQQKAGLGVRLNSQCEKKSQLLTLVGATREVWDGTTWTNKVRKHKTEGMLATIIGITHDRHLPPIIPRKRHRSGETTEKKRMWVTESVRSASEIYPNEPVIFGALLDQIPDRRMSRGVKKKKSRPPSTQLEPVTGLASYTEKTAPLHHSATTTVEKRSYIHTK